MSVILQLETATTVCSVALSVNGKTIALKEENEPNIHASKLTLFIEQVLHDAGIAFRDLDAVAVSKGPGSYTGLRIGVSTAKGLSFALDKPCIVIPTLQMMANGFMECYPDYDGLIAAMIDARRMEVFTAVYDTGLNEIVPTQAKIMDELSFLDVLDKQLLTFIGNGAEKCRQLITHPHAQFNAANFNSAKYMSSLAYKAFLNQDFVDVAYFEPFYLKDFVFTQPKKKI